MILSEIRPGHYNAAPHDIPPVPLTLLFTVYHSSRRNASVLNGILTQLFDKLLHSGDFKQKNSRRPFYKSQIPVAIFV